MQMFKVIDIAEGRFGKKVMAAVPIPVNTAIVRFSGLPVKYEETLRLGEQESFAFQVSDSDYIYLDIPARFINHSCDPNCGVTPELDLLAIRDIPEGEELTYDYSTTMMERDWTMRCRCGSKRCRGTVNDFDRLPSAIQEYYLNLGVVQDYIREKMTGQ